MGRRHIISVYIELIFTKCMYKERKGRQMKAIVASLLV